MAARTVPGAGAADKPAPRRVVPGAAPPAPSKSGKKQKGGAAKDTAAAVKIPDATSAALIEKAPEGPKQVANGLKVTPQDLAEQAEAQAAVAAVDAVQSSSESAVASTPAQKVISDRIHELSNKSKNATITVAVDELKSLLRKVQKVESESPSPAPSASTDSDSKSHLVLLLQFLHLFNLFHPNPAGPSTFAPSRTMPPALEMSTGQEVAALGKVYDQLANGPLEGGGGDALEILANIEEGSSEEVLPDVTFATLKSMILKLTAPPSAANKEIESKASGLDAPPQDFVPIDKQSPSSAPVSFIQASEILDQSTKEPEGGQPSSVPATGDTETKKGKQGGAGIVLGDKEATSSKADGTAASAVEEPINTTVKSSSGPTTTEPKLNWAAMAEEDDDDLGDAPVFEPLPSSTTSALVTPAPGTPTAVEPEQTAAPVQPATATPTAKADDAPLSPKPKKGKQNNGTKSNAGGRQTNGNGNAKAAVPPPTPKGPKVDEDGFILQESKKTKYLQQKQQQQQGQRGGSGGGRGSGKGAASGGRGGKQPNAGGNRGERRSGEPRSGTAAAAPQ
ncbi:hypothetical protein PSEUBRA_004442 [Kalmanozyma brasiliensis GHG001]|uniref:Uncharacterized protein n=1 Tax=Kalmanozyma brasiliensis (strain GHG001) TaxID=1365824 RepID=V5EW87_KALBG|nr:uncharacterized protein PSEUBRA_004442 [Kalmanozyma brasiliensis GHG001]EST06534.1 hypothetical protein PSEUBRA_004442 [Kalmanozyma brasiliensis GHG001]